MYYGPAQIVAGVTRTVMRCGTGERVGSVGSVLAVHVSAQCRMYMCRGSCPVVLCAVHSALTDRESESPTLHSFSTAGTSHPQTHSHGVVDGVTDGRYIARRTGVRNSHSVSISDLENGPSLSRGLTLLAPRVHPWPCRCSSGNRRALQSAAGRCRALQDDQIVCPDRTPHLGALRRSSQPHLTVPFTQPSTMPSPRNPRHPALHSTLLAENSWMSCRAAASSALRLSLTFSASAAAASAPA
jgi:hypothetical protein